MKKSIFITVALFAFTSITSQLFAQEATVAKGQHIAKATLVCRVSSTETGCTIAFESSPPAPDAASGTALTKKGYDYYQAKSAFSVSAVDNSVTEVKSPRDAATGQSSGKRMHKPMTVTKQYDKSSPMLAKSVSSSSTASSGIAIDEPGVQSKVNVQDISFTKRCGGKTTKISCDGGDCEIPIGDCPNGDCSITADWSWGMSQSGGSNRCSVYFLLKIEDGACTAMAINEKGLPGDKKPAKEVKYNSPK
ncbi:type VI secretion system tube protein Hcp [Flavobacterium sp.]|uniref:type VI secretion system tube protein Hcp n=1 Tax=Flavobacterium sp. TaxID=239 RepID=UPI003751E171